MATDGVPTYQAEADVPAIRPHAARSDTVGIGSPLVRHPLFRRASTRYSTGSTCAGRGLGSPSSRAHPGKMEAVAHEVPSAAVDVAGNVQPSLRRPLLCRGLSAVTGSAGAASPRLAASPGSVNLGSITLGDISIGQFTVTNTSAQTDTITDYETTGPDADDFGAFPDLDCTTDVLDNVVLNHQRLLRRLLHHRRPVLPGRARSTFGHPDLDRLVANGVPPSLSRVRGRSATTRSARLGRWPTSATRPSTATSAARR